MKKDAHLDVGCGRWEGGHFFEGSPRASSSSSSLTLKSSAAELTRKKSLQRNKKRSGEGEFLEMGEIKTKTNVEENTINADTG